jgi:hypothetical protein
MGGLPQANESSAFEPLCLVIALDRFVDIQKKGGHVQHSQTLSSSAPNPNCCLYSQFSGKHGNFCDFARSNEPGLFELCTGAANPSLSWMYKRLALVNKHVVLEVCCPVVM